MITIMSGLVELLIGLPGQPVTIAAGETVFHRGGGVRFLYVVRSGCIHLTRSDPDGRAAVMQRAMAGAVLAESSIFSDVYHCDAVALADSDLLRIARGTVRKAMQSQPRFMEAVAHHLAGEVQRTRIRLEVLSRKTVRERFDAWLAFGDGQWPRRGAMAAVAQDIGVSPEAFYRELRRRRGARARP